MANMAEEARPCAIIIIRAPDQPQFEEASSPARRSPMWETDE